MKGLENAIRNLNSLDTRMVPQASAWAINRVAQKAVSVATRQVAGNTVAGDIAPPDIPAGFVAVLTMRIHHGISLKTTGEKRSMTWHQGTRYLFLNSARYQKMSLVVAGWGISEVERHNTGEGCGSRKTVSDTGSGRNKK